MDKDTNKLLNSFFKISLEYQWKNKEEFIKDHNEVNELLSELKADYCKMSKDAQEQYKKALGKMLTINIISNPCVRKIVEAEEKEKGRELTYHEEISLIEKLLDLKRKKIWV